MAATYTPLYINAWEDDERAPYRQLPQRQVYKDISDDDGSVIKHIREFWQEERERLYVNLAADTTSRRKSKTTYKYLGELDAPIQVRDAAVLTETSEEDTDDDIISSSQDESSDTEGVSSGYDSTVNPVIEPEQDPLFIMAGAAKFAYT